MTQSMMSNRFFAFAGLVLLVAAPAHGQSPRPERPYRGLFGSTAGDTEQSLSASASVGTGWDQNLRANAQDLSGARTGGPPISGTFGAGSASLSYQLSRDRVTAGASSSTSARYYPSAAQHVLRTYAASAGTEVQLSDSTGVSLSAYGTYQPYTYGALFNPLFAPGVGAAPVADLELASGDTQHYTAYGAGAGISHRLSQRSSIGANYSFRASERPGPGSQGYRQHGVGASYNHEIDKGLSVVLGYGYGVADYGGSQPLVRSHSMNGGLNYGKTLSFSRRTSLSFGTGTYAAATTTGSTHYGLAGSARLEHEIGRTWTAAAVYSRGLRFSETWIEPVVSDSVSVGLGGLFTRSLQFRTSLLASKGGIGFSGQNSDFTTVFGGAGLSYGLVRSVSLNVNYSYYNYMFGSAVILPPGAPRVLERQSVMASVSVWAPLFEVRRRNASR